MNAHAPAANQPVFNERGLLDANIPPEADIQRAMLRQPGQSFAQWMESRVARFQTRRYDWDALKFQADYDPKYRRAQMRYIGTGGPVGRDVAWRHLAMFLGEWALTGCGMWALERREACAATETVNVFVGDPCLVPEQDRSTCS